MSNSDELRGLVDSGDYLLFLGAGFSADGGIPLWEGALLRIADKLTSYSPAHADLIRQEAKHGRFLESAEILYLAPITTSQRNSILTDTFGIEPAISSRQKQLMKIACQGFVTTNFDRCLPKAASEAGVDLVAYSESDADLANARVSEKRFSVRLNGRIEVADSLIFAARHYASLTSRTSYIEFFRELFLNRNLIFLGFSFADPFITSAIQEMSKTVHSVFKRKAIALFSSEPSPEKAGLLLASGISWVKYSSANRHQEAWDLLLQSKALTSPSQSSFQEERVRSELAAIYARSRSRYFISDRIQVLSGLFIPLLQRIGIGNTVTNAEYEASIRDQLALPDSIPRAEIFEATKRLERDGLVSLEDAGVKVVSLPDPIPLSEAVGILVQGITARSRVRYGLVIPSEVSASIANVVVSALVADGLRLAHGIIRGKPLSESRLIDSIEKMVANVSVPTEISRQPIADAIVHLFMSPDSKEEETLSTLSSLVFATSLLLVDPLAATSAQARLGMGAFLDTNILLPWISKGHPLCPVYDSIVGAFPKGALYVIPEYVSEVVFHRSKALEIFDEAGLADRERFKRFISYFHAHRINAYIGGYAGRVAGGYARSFESYLNEVAPFKNDETATAYLETLGVTIVRRPAHTSAVVGGTAPALREALEHNDQRRAEVVIRSDARQLDMLTSWVEKGSGPLFVTADRILVRAIGHMSTTLLLDRLILPPQALYLVQLIGKKDAAINGISRALWTTTPDHRRRIREYYIDRILGEYEYALVAEIPQIVDSIIDEYEDLTAKIGPLESIEETGGKSVREFTALDRFEVSFYEKMLLAKKGAGLV